MKILLSWLKDYVQFDKTAEELAEDLSMFAHEVESVTKIGDDAVLDLEITPNRGDCLSHLGIARQIAAMYNLSLNIPEVKINETKLEKTIDLQITPKNVCPRFTARIIENITIQPSPKWLQDRIIAYGFRPINNIVDITNYVMIAQGQPLHAFDLDKISDAKMHIRLSKEGEKVMTLDGKDRNLPIDSIVIEDSEKIFDLAGVMGGEISAVDDKTQTIVLQGAIFDPILIRRTSKKLHHQTDASYRYERGVDFEGTVYGVDLATALILESCPEAKAGELIDRKQVQSNLETIPFSLDKINHLLGTNFDQLSVNAYLERLYFKVTDGIATVPSFRRFDVTIWQDLAEEIARVHGLSNIERKLLTQNASVNIDPAWQKREALKDFLKAEGLSEIYSTSFETEDRIKLMNLDISKCVRIINPIAPETTFLRPNLLPSLLLAVGKNPWAPEVNIFEIEKVFYNDEEKWQVGIASVGKTSQLLDRIKDQLALKAEVQKVEQNILDFYKIRRPVSIIIFTLEEVKLNQNQIDYHLNSEKLRPISRFAPTIRDLSIVVDMNVTAEDIQKEILGASDAILFSEKFDEFISDKFGANKKSVAFHLWLQDLKAVISDEVANDIMTKVLKRLTEKFQAELRS